MTSDGGVRCMLMRGGTSKGAYFLRDDLPSVRGERDDLLLRILGSPDPRQIDGIGGAHPLTSKVAVVAPASSADADVDYLFLRVQVDEPRVSAGQPCGNLLAGIGPFAVERGLFSCRGDSATVRIRMVNTGGLAIARFGVPGGRVEYAGETAISGVPFPGAPIALTFAGTEGSVCGSLLPTGHDRDEIDGIPVTCIDNGMPVVLVAAGDLGVTGYESCADLEANRPLRDRVEQLRLKAGDRMDLGDVTAMTIPKVTLLAPPRDGGTLTTRTFIPHRCHTSIGVFGAVTVASAVRLPGSVAAAIAAPTAADGRVRLEHPSGYFDTEVADDASHSVAVVRTARKLFDGLTWPRAAAS
jgi:4-oxalomesaconate tautomerase